MFIVGILANLFVAIVVEKMPLVIFAGKYLSKNVIKC